MTHLERRLERDVAETEARANAGEDVRANLPGLERRARRVLRLVDYFGRRTS